MNMPTDLRQPMASPDAGDHEQVGVVQTDPRRRHSQAVTGPTGTHEARRTLFAGGEASVVYTARGGKGLLVAFVLHAVALTPFFVSTIHVQSQPTPVPEAVGITFVMVPERGAGSPSPSSQPEPERRESSPEPPKPLVSEPPAELPLLAAETPTPLVAALTLSALPGPVSPNDAGETSATEKVATAEPIVPTASGPGGHSDSSLPPAIGTRSSQSNWAGLVLGRLEQFRRYPAAARRSRQEGICHIRFTIDREGHVLGASLERTSGHESLDREAVALVRRADPLPAPPPELEGETVTLTVPVEFFLTR